MDNPLNLDSDKVSSAYPGQPLAIAPDATIGDAIQLMSAQKTGAVLVCDDQGLRGIFTERDGVKVLAQDKDLSSSIASVMSAEPVTLSSNGTVADAIKRMSGGGYRHLPIVDDDGQPTGIAAVRGIVHYLVEHFPGTVYNLPPTPSTKQSQREGA